ncbi:unnamed protein product [Lampetra fluviatilis]
MNRRLLLSAKSSTKKRSCDRWSEKEALRALPAALDEGTLAAFLSILPLERSSLMQAFDQLVSIYEPPLVAHHKVAKCVGAQQLLHRDRALVTWSQGHRIERGPLRKARRLGVVATGVVVACGGRTSGGG